MGWIITEFALGMLNLVLFINDINQELGIVTTLFSLVATVICFGTGIYMLWEELHY